MNQALLIYAFYAILIFGYYRRVTSWLQLLHTKTSKFAAIARRNICGDGS